MEPALPTDLTRVILKIGGAPCRELGRDDPQGVPVTALLHMVDMAIVIFERDRVEDVRAVIGSRTICAHVEEIAGTRYVVVTELMQGHPFMKSLKRWCTRWLRKVASDGPPPRVRSTTAPRLGSEPDAPTPAAPVEPEAEAV